MSAMEMLLLLGFGMPIVGLSALFVHEAQRMMHAEAMRAKMYRDTMRARKYEAMRRKARGTPRRRPGSVTIR